jgi:hypothetical protein
MFISPDLDVSVGPFATRVGERREGEYDAMAKKSRRFIERIIREHERNIEKWRLLRSPAFKSFVGPGAINWNARCFIAVEIENTGSLKHLLGSTINAVALGRVGLLVGFREERVRRFLRCLQYLSSLRLVGKPNIGYQNGLVLSREQFVEILEDG